MRTLEPKGVGSFIKLCHLMCCWIVVVTLVQLLGGTPPLKFGRAKNVQSLVHFTTTLDFDCKHLWTG